MDWNEVYTGIRALAGRAATKINQTADMATLQVKLSMAEHKLEEAYAVLGKASFGHFVEDKDNIDQISSAITNVKNAMLEIRSIKTQIEELRQRVIDAETEAEHFKQTLSLEATEAANAVKAAQAAKKDAEARAEAVRVKQEEEAEPLEVFDFDDAEENEEENEEAPVSDLSTTGDAIEIEIETED